MKHDTSTYNFSWKKMEPSVKCHISKHTYIQNRVLLYIKSVNHTRKELCINYISINTSNFTGFLCLIN